MKKRKKRDASPTESTAKKPRDYPSMDIIVIDDEDGNNDTMASPNEDADRADVDNRPQSSYEDRTIQVFTVTSCHREGSARQPCSRFGP